MPYRILLIGLAFAAGVLAGYALPPIVQDQWEKHKYPNYYTFKKRGGNPYIGFWEYASLLKKAMDDASPVANGGRPKTLDECTRLSYPIVANRSKWSEETTTYDLLVADFKHFCSY